MKKLSLCFILFGLLVSGHVFAQSAPATGYTPQINSENTALTPCTTTTDSSDCYQLLEKFPTSDPENPYLTNVDVSATGKGGIGGFINFAIEIGIGIAGILGVIMLTIYGFQYAAEDKNVATFAELRTRITSVVLGLLLLLGIFVILKTINPDLLIVEPDINKILLPSNEADDSAYALEQAFNSGNKTIIGIYAPIKAHMRDGGTLQPPTEAARKQMVGSIPIGNLMDLSVNGVTIKPGAGKMIQKSVGVKIVALNNALKQQGVAFTVTEAFKPTTYKHYAACQYTGTCIDADLPFNVGNIVKLINEASKQQLIVVWETKNPSDYKALIAAGVPKSNVLFFKTHITGDHFSLYDYQ